REERGRRGQRKHGGLTVSGEQAAKQAHKPLKQRKQKGPKPLPDGNPAAFRSWYVPEGVETGPGGHRNAGERAPKKQGRRGGGKAQRAPYGHPGNAPNFPSDHAHGAGATPYGDRPRGPKPKRPG